MNMAEKQQKKTKVAGLVLPNPTSTDLSSQFLEKLTGATVSQIVYARNLFDEKDFVDMTFEDISIKVVKGTSKNSDAARCLSRWLEGAFDALNRQYLKSISLEIVDGKENRKLEDYTFNYSYLDGIPQCKFGIENESVSIDPQVQGARKEEVRQFLRSVLVSTALSKKLPPNCVTNLRLSYYDEVTPTDYEPPGFKPVEETETNSKGKYLKLLWGKVSTPFHSMSFKTSVLEQMTPESNAAKNTVQCICHMDDSVAGMLACVQCKTLQHASCYKVFSEEDASQKIHTCMKCSNTPITKDFEPMECIFRRVLMVCLKSRSVSITSLMRATKYDAESISILIRRLQREEVLEKADVSVEKPDYAYCVIKNNIPKKLKKKYFNV